MPYIKTNTRLVGTKNAIATKDIESLQRRFEIMQDETLRTPTRVSITCSDGSTCSKLHRLFVRIYYVPSEKDQPTR
jgi:hypothetical protein